MNELNEVQTLLLAARTLIADPKDWTVFEQARTASDIPVAAEDERAVKFCAVGALKFVAIDDRSLYPVAERAKDILNDVAQQKAWAHIVELNNWGAHEQLMAAFDRAIELAGRT